MKKLFNLCLLSTTLLCCTLFTACTNNDYPAVPTTPQHTEATEALIRICNENAEVKQLLEHAIAQAAEINPDRQYNPAQSLSEFYEFIDWNVRQLPWNVMIHQAPSDYGRSLYGRTDQDALDHKNRKVIHAAAGQACKRHGQVNTALNS